MKCTRKHKEGTPAPGSICPRQEPLTFLSAQVDVQGRDHLPAQGLPPPHDHVDGPLPVEERLEGLLLVLVDEVHVVDPQQPVIDPVEDSLLSTRAGLGTSGPLSCSHPGS